MNQANQVACERPALLIVDDEAETLKALRRELRRDYEVVIAQSAEEGYGRMRERPIQVILSDQRMPGMTGTQFYEKVRAEFPETVRLLMTAYVDTNAAIQAINQGGVFRFITKPWDPAELAAVVRDAFRQHELLREARRLTGALKARADELVQENQRLMAMKRARDELVGIAAHDLRNPIGAIQWSATMLLAAAGDPHKDLRRQVQRIQANAAFTLQLLDDLLDIATLEHGEVALRVEDTDLKSVVAAAVSRNEHSAGRKGIALAVDLPSGPLPVRCDPGRIEQVLSNLLSNAFKFSHPGTTVTVRAQRLDEAIRVVVEDQGLGIRPEEIGGLFRKFRRTSTQSTGGEKSTGLGLAICKEIVERHGGAIHVESELGQGTRVAFTLPAPAERRA